MVEQKAHAPSSLRTTAPKASFLRGRFITNCPRNCPRYETIICIYLYIRFRILHGLGIVWEIEPAGIGERRARLSPYRLDTSVG